MRKREGQRAAPEAFPSCQAPLLATRRHLAPGPFVPRIVRIVARGIVVAGVPDGIGRDTLLELLDLEFLHVTSPCPGSSGFERHHTIYGWPLPSGLALPSGFALPDGL